MCSSGCIAIIKLFSTRRHPDEAQKQSIKDAAVKLSAILLQHLQPVDIGTSTISAYGISSSLHDAKGGKLDVAAYYTSLLGVVATFLIEKRSGAMTLYTFLLSTFHKDGAFDALLVICQPFIIVVEELSVTGQDARAAEQATDLGSTYGRFPLLLPQETRRNCA